YGLLYYAALITTLPLEPDAPLAEPACPHPGCVAMYKRIGTTPCLRVCPACLSGTVQDGRIQQSTYDREKCHSRAQTYGIGSFQKGLLQIVNEDDPAATSQWVRRSMGTTERIQSVGRRLAQYIESELGYYAVYVPPGTASGDTPFLSFMLAAQLAGLGSKSLAGPVLNREHGFMYWSAVITTAPLDADGPESSPACPAPACREMWDRERTTPCLATCPGSNGGCLSGKLENGRAVRTFYDAARCNTRVHTHWVGGFQKVLE